MKENKKIETTFKDMDDIVNTFFDESFAFIKKRKELIQYNESNKNLI